MKTHFLATLLALACGSVNATPAGELIVRYSQAYRGLGMTYLALSYRENIASLVRETDVPAQKRLFGDVARELKLLDTGALSPCQRLDLNRIAFEADTNLQKLAVLEQFAALGSKAEIGANGLYSAPAGRAWYRYFLRRWLSSSVAPEELMTSGRAELAAVLARSAGSDGLRRQGCGLLRLPEKPTVHVRQGRDAAIQVPVTPGNRVRQPAQAVPAYHDQAGRGA